MWLNMGLVCKSGQLHVERFLSRVHGHSFTLSAQHTGTCPVPTAFLHLLPCSALPVAVTLNCKRSVTGTLRGFDQFMNVVLDNTVDNKNKTDIGMVVSGRAPAGNEGGSERQGASRMPSGNGFVCRWRAFILSSCQSLDEARA
jgi:small nuclear ribonucleoprotein (snRNP)-like protein